MSNLPATENLLLVREDNVLRIGLNRVEARNALSGELVTELQAVLKAVHSDRSLSAIVLRGEGGVFCAGADIKGFKAGQDSPDNAAAVSSSRQLGDMLVTLNEQPQVVVALVEGAAIGGGLGLACCADITLTTRDARLRLSETSLGLPPAQIAPFVVDRTGLAQARRLMLTGARFSGEAALALGIAHYVVADAAELQSCCDEVLVQISQCGPEANAATKRILFETLRLPRAEALDYAAGEFGCCLSSAEAREGIAAFLEKRQPDWSRQAGNVDEG